MTVRGEVRNEIEEVRSLLLSSVGRGKGEGESVRCARSGGSRKK
jgi:hypothetical protein